MTCYHRHLTCMFLCFADGLLFGMAMDAALTARVHSTGASDTPQKSVARYQRTATIVLEWMLAESDEQLRPSLAHVRALHNAHRVTEHPTYLSWVLFLFVRYILVSHTYGMRMTCKEKKAYVRRWAHIAAALGVPRKLNFCRSVACAEAACRAYESTLLNNGKQNLYTPAQRAYMNVLLTGLRMRIATRWFETWHRFYRNVLMEPLQAQPQSQVQRVLRWLVHAILRVSYPITNPILSWLLLRHAPSALSASKAEQSRP